MEKIKLIAETAWHHDGDFAFMNKLVNDIINNAKLDILKMHKLIKKKILCTICARKGSKG